MHAATACRLPCNSTACCAPHPPAPWLAIPGSMHSVRAVGGVAAAPKHPPPQLCWRPLPSAALDLRQAPRLLQTGGLSKQRSAIRVAICRSARAVLRLAGTHACRGSLPLPYLSESTPGGRPPYCKHARGCGSHSMPTRGTALQMALAGGTHACAQGAHQNITVAKTVIYAEAALHMPYKLGGFCKSNVRE